MPSAARACVLAFVILTIAPVALARDYSGRLIDVVDQLNTDHPDLIIGLDPAILAKCGQLQLRFTAGTDWQTDFKDALGTLSLTSISLKQYDHILVSTPGAIMLYRGLQYLEGGQFITAGSAFKSALAAEPDNLQLQALATTAADLAPLHKALRDADVQLNKAILERKSDRTIAALLDSHGRAFASLWGTFWLDLARCSDRDLQTEIYPLCVYASKTCDRCTTLLSLCQRRYPQLISRDVLDVIKQVRSRLSDTSSIVNGRILKAQLRLSQGIEFFQGGKQELALPILLESYDLNPSDLKCRTYLGWLQAERRLQHHRERADFVNMLRQPPEIPKLVKGLGAFLDDALQANDPHLATVLVSAIDHANLPVSPERQQLDRLRRLADTPPRDAVIGQEACFVSTGSEFSAVRLTPVTITFSRRQDTSTFHELSIEGIDPVFRGYLDVPASQALGWVDSTAGSILFRYRIGMRFDDPEAPAAGDSLGAAIGIAGFSALYRVPMRPTVAIVGSIRAYGALAGVGGVPARVAAAIDAHKLALVLPLDNEPDLDMLTVEQTRRIRIILADQMSGCLGHLLDGAVPPEKQAAIRRADDLYRIARLLEVVGKYPEARAVFAKVSAEEPNDYTARTALALYDQAPVQSKWPEWLDRAQPDGSDAPGATPPTAETSFDGLVKDMPAQLALHATVCAANPDQEQLAEQLLRAALLLDPSCREGLLLKARLSLGQKIAPPDAGSGMLPRAKVAGLLVARARQAGDSGDPKSMALGDVYWRFVLSYFDLENEPALLAFSAARQEGRKFDVNTLLDELDRQLHGAPEAKNTVTFALTPEPVAAVDTTALPAEGRLWSPPAGALDDTQTRPLVDDDKAEAAYRTVLDETFDGYRSGASLRSAGWVNIGRSGVTLTNATAFGPNTRAIDASTLAYDPGTTSGHYAVFYKDFDKPIPVGKELIITYYQYIHQDAGRNRVTIGLRTDPPRHAPKLAPTGFALSTTESGWFIERNAGDFARSFAKTNTGRPPTGAYRIDVRLQRNSHGDLMMQAEATPITGGRRIPINGVGVGGTNLPIVGIFISFLHLDDKPMDDLDHLTVKVRD